ncbi:hypothetical protein HD806DRAFT_413055 [Xylariaceae sp. AK1471]|nr:hypothetical protein HD806DRAFT_413055 [Xylariaceae sp. AK1471]
MNNSDKPTREHNQTWLVRAGTFVCILGCKMAIETAELKGDTDNNVTHDQAVYAKPMKLTAQTSGLTSTLHISISRIKDGEVIKGWGMEKVVKFLPAGLWGEYNPSTDPLESRNNNIPDLLSPSKGTIGLLAGVRLTAPPPKESVDPYPAFDLADAESQDLSADKPFLIPKDASKNWEPARALEGKQQWEVVREKWATPDWAMFGEEVQEEFIGGWAAALGWDTDLSKWAKMPTRMYDQFDTLYVAAPLITERGPFGPFY